MTTYTDQPIPLAELGKISQANSRKNAGKAKAVDGQGKTEDEKPKPDLTLIDLVGNAVAISRKVDPDRPVLRSLQRLMGEHLVYDRRTGDFQVPSRGMAYLYDLDDGSQQQNGAWQCNSGGHRPTHPADLRKARRASRRPRQDTGQDPEWDQ